MRSDTGLAQDEFRRSDLWQIDPLLGQVDVGMATRYSRGKEKFESGEMRWHSFSGHERNCFFRNQDGQGFSDESAISGADSIADGRSFAWFDYDRDGWLDMALVNANKPMFQLYRSRMSLTDAKHHRFIALRFSGGNHTPKPSPEWSAADAYGARATLELSGMRLSRTFRCGEGFAAQNSDTLIIGLNDADRVDRLEVLWPSGKTTSIENIEVNQLVTAREIPDSEGRSFVISPYPRAKVSAFVANSTRPLAADILPAMESSSFHLVMTTATWCDACKGFLPQVQRLSAAVEEAGVKLWGLPSDPIETREQILAYVEEYQPTYEMLSDLEPPKRDHLLSLIRQQVGANALPASLLFDSEGHLLLATVGVPTVSQVAQACEKRAR